MVNNVILHIDYTEIPEQDFLILLKNIIQLQVESLLNWLEKE